MQIHYCHDSLVQRCKKRDNTVFKTELKATGSLQTIQIRGQVQWNYINAFPVENLLDTEFKREISVIFSMVWLLWLYCKLKVASHISGMSEESRFGCIKMQAAWRWMCAWKYYSTFTNRESPINISLENSACIMEQRNKNNEADW